MKYIVCQRHLEFILLSYDKENIFINLKWVVRMNGHKNLKETTRCILR